VRAPRTLGEWMAWSSAALVLAIVAGAGYEFLLPLALQQNSPTFAASIAGLWGLAIALPLALNTLTLLGSLTGRKEATPDPKVHATLASSSLSPGGAAGAQTKREDDMRGRIKLTLTVLSVVAMCLGAWWILQGIGVVPLGSMANHLTWAFRGAVLFLLGLLALIFARYR